MEKIFIVEWDYAESKLHTFENEVDAARFIENYAADNREDTNYSLHNLEVIKGVRLNPEVVWLKDSKFNVELKTK